MTLENQTGKKLGENLKKTWEEFNLAILKVKTDPL